MWRTVLAGVRARKRRTLSTGLAVLLGVAFLSGTLMLGDTLQTGFNNLFADLNAETDVLVRSSSEVDAGEVNERGVLDSALVDVVDDVEGVAVAAPFVEGAAQFVDRNGDPVGGEGPPTMATNWVEDERLNPYQIIEGRAPQAADEVVVDTYTAEQAGLGVGDGTVIYVPQPVEVTVVGQLQLGERNGIGGATYVAFTTEAAQELLVPTPNSLTSIMVRAEEGVTAEELQARVASALPDSAEALTGEALTAELTDQIDEDFLGFIDAFLLTFAGIALVVASFSIYNTFTIVVAQRTRESALLRAIGASRRQVLSGVLVEAIFIGLLSAGAGALAGIGLSRALLGVFDLVDVEMPDAGLVIEPSSMLLPIVVGLIVTLGASLAPAVRASRIRPIAALREVGIDGAAASRWRIASGAVVLALGMGAAAVGAIGGALATAGAGALAVVIGFALCGPVVAKPASQLLGAPFARLRGVTGGLARANATRNPTRTAGTATALIVGVAVVVTFTVFAASLKQHIDTTARNSFEGDLVLEGGGFSGAGLSPELIDQVGSLPDVDVSTGLSWGPVQLDGDDTLVDTADGPGLDQVLDLEMVNGSMADLSGQTIALSDDFATSEGYAVGDEIPAGFADGDQADLTVVAVYDTIDMLGPVVMAQDVWLEHTTQPQYQQAFVGLSDGADQAAARASVEALVGDLGIAEVMDRDEFVGSVASEIDQFLAIIYVMLAMAIIIAVMGIANTLSLSAYERTRELGLLRAVGQSKRQLRAMVRGESVIVSVFGSAVGLGLGCFLGWVFLRAVSEVEDVTVSLALPTTQLLIVLLLGAVVGVLAAVRPARRAAKLNILEAMATE